MPMTHPKDLKAADLVQHFWESGLMFLGFAVLFWWDDGPLELRIVLALLLIRMCFSWGETSVLEKQISALAFENAKRHAILQGLVFELDRKLAKRELSSEGTDSAEEAARNFLEKMAKGGKSFEESYDGSTRLDESLSTSASSRAWTSILGSVIQVALLALLAWGITALLKGI